MVIRSPFFDKLNYYMILNSYYEYKSLYIAVDRPRKKMGSEELEIYEQKYEEFRKKYKLKPSSGMAGMMLSSNEQLVTPYKLYIDPGLDTFDFAEMVINRCKYRGLDYKLKFITPEEIKSDRPEKLIVYGTDSKNISEFYDMIKELMKENNYIEFSKPPIFTDNLDGNIGLGFDFIDEKTLLKFGLQNKCSFNSWITPCMSKNINKFRKLIGKPKEQLKVLVKVSPEIREYFRKYLNIAYINLIKKIPGIEQFIILVEWYLNDNREYMLKTFQNDCIKEYTSEEAIKLFDLTPPNFEWVLNKDGEYRLKEIIIDKNGYKRERGYTLQQARKNFGLTPPDYKYYKDDQKLSIERNAKK